MASCWAFRHQGEFGDGAFCVRLGGDAGQVRDALGYLLRLTGVGERDIPETLDGRSAVWQRWSTGKAVVLVIDDALLATQVRPLLPGPGRSAVIVVEHGSVGELRSWNSAQYVTSIRCRTMPRALC